MKTQTLKSFAAGALLLAAGQSALRAQQYSIDWHKVSGGGGVSTGATYEVSGTIGQPDASGAMTGGNYSLTGGFWALYAIQTPGAPTLFITKFGNSAILSWSADASGYVLEDRNSLATPNAWSTVSPAPMTINGFKYVTNTITPGNNFYRLHHP